jgi:transposase-like protein
MRLNLILPVIEPERYQKQPQCVHCGGRQTYPRQDVVKKIVDGKYSEVVARRYHCRKCERTFRVYPQGVCKKQFSQRALGLAAMLYVMGLSYGATAAVLTALDIAISKSTVYRVVQRICQQVPGLRREGLVSGYTTPALGADLTSIRCNGEWLTLGICVDETNGWVLSIDQLDGADTDTLQNWLQPLIEHFDAQVLVTDDADAFKTVADTSGVAHQVCKSHVLRNTEALIEDLLSKLSEKPDPSLQTLNISNAQARQDLTRLRELTAARLPEDQFELEQLFYKYADARKPPKGKHTLAYRIRNLFMDRWNLWPRLTFYRSWLDPDDQSPLLDGTNNATERAIGWWIKERYRSMKAYKSPLSALGVSRLVAFMGGHLHSGLPLADFIN